MITPGLRRCWHPVSYSRDLNREPRATTLLSEALVLWRDSQGIARVMRDLCIHRGTALSLGTICGDEIVCPYHGWRYGTDGVCTAIPQLQEPTSGLPLKARVDTFHSLERYGLVWVALDEPQWPLPLAPEFCSETWKVVLTGPFEWQCDASRQVENFTDFGHFAFVHPGLLGDPDRPVVPAHEVQTDGHILRYSIVRPEAPNVDHFPIFANRERTAPQRHSRYDLHLPYTIVLRLGWGEDRGMVYLFASQPITPTRCAGYCAIARNYNFDQPDDVLQDFESVIFEQDRRVVESQRPEQVPFDLAAELHMRFDAVAVAYRRAMKAHCLALDGNRVTSTTSPTHP